MNVDRRSRGREGRRRQSMAKYGRIDILVSNAGVQIVRPVVDFHFADWKKMLAIHLDGAFLTTRACLKHMYAAKSGSIIYMGSVHSKEASVLKAPYVTAKHGLIGLCRSLPRKAPNTTCVPTWSAPASCERRWWTSRSPSRPRSCGISEDDVIKNVMLKDTVDGEFTTTDDVAEAVLFFAGARPTP